MTEATSHASPAPRGTGASRAPATAADYGWIRASPSLFAYALEGGYTLTLVRGLAPARVLEVVGAEPADVCEGFDGLVSAHDELLDVYGYSPDSFLAGAFAVPGEGGDWTLVMEFGGDVGTRPRFMEALSAGSRAVSHTSNGGKPMDFFHWYEAGELRLTFESPADRAGSTPDELNGALSELGLNPSGDPDPGVDEKAAVFALAERLTGVRVTEELLRDAVYVTGEVFAESAG
ncbi:DUF6461 domain-containing protein [Streptomyces sp. NPDC051546]|uniref:DUF6461 domain-containing protein n=1 Tax=Streptomyces sp. NPDC051546 TaxID=3365655 RepID=UPI0037B3CDFD